MVSQFQKQDLVQLVQAADIEEHANYAPGPCIGFVYLDLATGKKVVTGRTRFPADFDVKLYLEINPQFSKEREVINNLLIDALNYFRAKVPGFGEIQKDNSSYFMKGNHNGQAFARYEEGRTYSVTANSLNSVDVFVQYAKEVLGMERIKVKRILGKEIVSNRYRSVKIKDKLVKKWAVKLASPKSSISKLQTSDI